MGRIDQNWIPSLFDSSEAQRIREKMDVFIVVSCFASVAIRLRRRVNAGHVRDRDWCLI